MENGLFITLSDEPSLALYLREGVFSQHQPAEMDDDVHHSSNHYKVMADYACAREGTHVFFFRERKIYYGGRAVTGADSNQLGAFWINGETSPMGRTADADLGWDESERYGGKDGIFERSTRNGSRDYAQPFLIRFDTDVEYAKKYIRSDDLYFALGDYPFPLKSNTIRGRGFCPMGPGETRKLLEQIEGSDQTYEPGNSLEVPNISLEKSLIKPYKPEYGIPEVKRKHLISEDHLEAAVIANPSLLPHVLRPQRHHSIVRQAPISPLKPMQIDHIDLSFYDPDFQDGMYPNQVIELKYSEPGNASQIRRYREAIDKMSKYHLDVNQDDIKVGMFSPSYDEEAFESCLDKDTIRRISFRQFEKPPESPNFTAQDRFF